MKLRSLLQVAIVSATALFAVQCKNAEQDRSAAQQAQGKQITITASLEQPTITKTSLSSENKVLWSAGDQIKVYNASHPSGAVYTLSSGAGTSLGEFSGDNIGDGPYYAIYPADAGGTLGETGIAVTLPKEQGYVAGSFGSGAAVSIAQAENIGNFSFRNVLGGVSFQVASDKAFSAIRLQTKGEEALNGAGTVKMSEGGVPQLTMADRTSDEGSFLYLKCPAEGASASSFVLMLPPGSFESGFMVEFLDKEGNVMFKSAKADVNKVVRSSIVDMPASTYTPTYKAAFFESDSFGFFPAIGAAAELGTPLSYDEAAGQYAFKNTDDQRYVRVQNLSQGFYAAITTPKVMALGGTYEVTVEKVEGSSLTSSKANYIAVQKTGDRVWLVNPEDNTGIIQKMED